VVAVNGHDDGPDEEGGTRGDGGQREQASGAWPSPQA